MTTYTQLQTDFTHWVKRTDLDDKLPGFVALFETKANRRLRVRRMESGFSGTVNSSNQIALPADFLAFKTLWAPGYERTTMHSQSLESVIATGRTTGTPTLYAVESAAVRFNGSGDVLGVYYVQIPGLVVNATNWLSVLAYEAYLFGALAEAALFEFDDQRAATCTARCDAVLNELIGTDQRDKFSGPLAARAR